MILFVVLYFETRMFDVSLCIHYSQNITLHAAVGQDYFRTIFPRLKHRDSFHPWCGDGKTGHANQALSFSVNMFHSFESLCVLRLNLFVTKTDLLYTWLLEMYSVWLKRLTHIYEKGPLFETTFFLNKFWSLAKWSQHWTFSTSWLCQVWGISLYYKINSRWLLS